MRAKSATFLISAAAIEQFPASTAREVAFAGRSNVGKSSLINMLTGHKGLARTSRTPGRTRLVNWFEVVPPKGAPVHFVDLPGYGFADVGVTLRKSWQPLIEGYLARDAISCVVLLQDIRREVTEDETLFLAWLEQRNLPVVVVLTKADKLPKNQRKPVVAKLRRDLNLTRDPVLFSTLDDVGQDDLWRSIMSTLL